MGFDTSARTENFKHIRAESIDPMALVQEDANAQGEARYILVGMSNAGQLLALCYTLRGNDAIRLISARSATKNERRQYEN